MNYILFDDTYSDHLLPFTFTRPVCEIRIGILQIREKWERHLKCSCSILTRNYLQKKFSINLESENTFINSRYIPDESLIASIENLQLEEALIKNDVVVAFRTSADIPFISEREGSNAFEALEFIQKSGFDIQDLKHDTFSVSNTWDIFKNNGKAIEMDIKLMSVEPSSWNDTATHVLGNQLYVEEGAKVFASNINTLEGPVYLGKNAVVMEGSAIRGPFALCEGSQVKMNAKIYGPTTIGPYSKVGGEINNSVIFGYSNKAHDGFLGNSVIGEWCNLGADTNTSNLKNNYAQVKMWDYVKKGMVNSGMQFCGLIMGDHSKCGINTMFNTGTVVGVSANIFGAGFPRNYIPSFSWGGAGGFITYQVAKAMEVAEIVFQRRNRTLDQTEKDILTEIFNITAENRPK